ncbi:MAG: transglycosylase domain-containing protein [Bradymonadales bacterium]|nr:transglycosylase domain-containing protein [Bradymonadales bacterium]
MLLVVELLAAWSVVRTDLFLHQPVERALQRVADQLGGRFTFQSIGPAGLTGIEIRQLVFQQTRGEPLGARIETVRLYADLGALVSGELRPGRISCAGLSLRLDMESISSLIQDRLVGDSNARMAGRSARRPSMPDWRSLWSRLPSTVLLESANLELEHSALWPSSRHLALEGLRIELATLGHRPEVRLAGSFRLEGLTGGRLLGRWEDDQGASVSFDFAEPLDLASSIRSGWFDPQRVRFPLPAGSSATMVGLDLVTSPGRVTLRGVEVANLNARIPGVERWRLDGFEADRLHVNLSPVGPRIRLESGQVLVAGILEWVALGVEEGLLFSDWSFHHPRAELTFRGPGEGRLIADLARSSYTHDLVVSLRGEQYPAREWGRLIPSELGLRLEAGEFTGQVDLLIPPEGGMWVASLDAALTGGQAIAPLISIDPLTAIDLALSGELTLDGRRRRLTWEEGELEVGRQTIRFDGMLGWHPGEGSLVLNASASQVDAAAFFAGIPRGLAPSLEETVWDGELSAFLYLDLDVTRPQESVVDLQLDLAGLGVTDYGNRSPIDRLAGDFALAIEPTDGSRRLIGPSLASWVSLGRVSDQLVGAVVSAEDVNFWSHEGFDWPGILQSVATNLQQRRFARGGSTISQQVARSLFLGHERTLGRKFEEAVLTWQMEQRLSKDRIMELYVNAVHWGPGIYGIGEAAFSYFGRRPDELSLRESAFLAAILPNPDLFGMQYARQIVVRSRREKICTILRNMRSNGEIGYQAYQENCLGASEGRISVSPVPAHLAERQEPLHSMMAPAGGGPEYLVQMH